MIRDVSLFCVVRRIDSAKIVNSFKYMKGTHTNNSRDKRKKRSKASSSTDPLTREHSRRHGKAVKTGITKAKQLKHAVLRAASRAKGKSKAQVAAELLVGSGPRQESVCAPSPGEPDGRRSPSLDWRAPEN